MAGLRNTFSVLTDDGSRDLIDERLTAAGMGTLERNFIGGRVGTDANAAASELASLRAAGQEQEAQAVQAQLEQLQQRRGFYAPEVGGVENIKGIGDALTWAGEAVGQGAASMQDPILATTAMNAGGRLLGMSKNPTAQLVSKALSWGAPAVAYGMNHDQLKGEFVQNAMRDPELMARTSWQDLNRTANIQAAGGAVLDTALPTVLGRQLVGKAGMSALGKLAPTSFGGRTLAAMGLEGATEVGQNVGSQIGLGYLNPNRDTSGDFMENVNAFAGGAVGAGPFSAAGAAAEGGYQRMGGVADALGKKAGDTVDLATGAVDSAKNKSRGWAEKLFGSNDAEDLQGGDGAASTGFKLSPDEYSTLNWAKANEKRANEPGFDEEFQAQEAKRTEFTVAKLAELAESDDKAADILERAGNAASPTEQIRILSEGSDYLLAKHDLDDLDATGRNNLPSKGGELVGRAAKGIAKGAVKVAGEVAKGVARGLSSKKNLQADESAESRAGAEASGLQARNFAAELHPDLPGVQAMAEHIAREIHSVAVSGQVPEGRAMRLAKHMHTIFGNDTLDVLDTIARLAGKEGSPAMRVLALEAGDLNLPGGMQRFREREMQAAKSVLSVIPRTRQEVLLKKGIDINRGKDRAQLMKLLGQLADGTGDAQLRQSLNIALGAQTVAKALEIMNGKALAKGRKATSEEATIFTDQEAEVLGDEMEVNEDGEVTDYVKRQGDKSVDKGRVPSLYRFNQSKVSRNNEASRDPFAPATKVSEGAVRDWREAAKEAKLMGRAAPEDPRVAAAASRPGLFRIGEGIAKELEALKASGKNSREAVQQVLSKHPGIKASTRQLLKEVNNDPNWTVTAKRASDVLDSMGADDTRRLAMYVDYLHKGIKSEGTTEEQKKRLEQKLEIADKALKDIYESKKAPTDTKSNVADKGGEDSSGIKSLGQERLDAAQRRVATAREKVKALRKQYAEEQRAGKEAGIDNALTLKDIADAGKAAKAAMQEYQELSSRIIEQNAAPTPEKGQEMTLPHRVRRQVVEEAKAYFAERYVVVAEQLTNRDITKLSVPEFQNMGRVAAEQMDFARQAESRAKSKAAKARKDGLSKEEADAILRQGENETNEIIDASNILEFFPKVSNSERATRKANLAAGRKDEGPKPVYIKAGDLVYWVRQQRGRVEDTSRGTSADHQYLMDLEEGISAVLESGLVANKLPGKRNRFGTLEFFHKSKNNKLGVPPSLRLVTKTAKYLGNRWGDDEARIDPDKARTYGEYLSAKEEQEAYEAEVAKESMKGETRVPEMAGAERDAIAENTPEQMPGFPSLAEMKRTRQTLRERMVAAGELADNAPEKNSFTSTGPKKTDKDVVPSEMERQRETDEFGRKIAQDEFTDQRFRSEFQGFDPATTIERETKMTAPGQAKDRGDAIRAKLIPGIGEGRTTFTAKQLEGINAIAARIRSAYRPEYRTKDDPGLVGGWHYLYPAAHALNADFLDGLKKDKDPAGLVDTLEFLRGQLTRALADSDASLKHKVAIAKLMAPGTSVARINESNVQGTLEKNAPTRDESLAPIEQTKTQAAPEVAAQEAPKSQSKPSGVGGVDLGNTGPYGKKDQAKSDQATKFIGRGSERSSTAKYAKAWGDRANTGEYTSADVVFVSAEGNRSGRVSPDLDEIGRAVEARATIITDDKANREREYNVGEREVAKFLTSKGYRETSPGRWTSASTNIANRAVTQGKKLASSDPGLRAAFTVAADDLRSAGKRARQAGLSREQFLTSPEFMNAMRPVIIHKLTGTAGAQAVVDDLSAMAHQLFAIKYDKDLEDAVASRLAATDPDTPAKLSDMMREIIVADVDAVTKVIARAVKTAVGDTNIFEVGKKDIEGNDGVYNYSTQSIHIARDADLGLAGTVLHEGVHAATVAAVVRDKGLHRAVYRLMDHIAQQNPQLKGAYGLKDSLEFLAEGLSNASFQRELAKIKPNDAVARYLGKTVANAWDAFVGLVRSALNLDPKHESALAQLLDLGGRAIVSKMGNPSAVTVEEFQEFFRRGVAPAQRARDVAEAMINSPRVRDIDRAGIRTELEASISDMEDDGLVPHKLIVAMAATLESFDVLPAGMHVAAQSIFTAFDANLGSGDFLIPNSSGRKLNAQDARKPGDTPASPEEIAKAKAWMNKVLPKVRVEFEKITGYSGEFIEAENLVRISTTAAAGVMQTAYHEGLHAFFAGLAKNPEAQRVLSSIADNRAILARLQALLREYPAAQKQLVDGEERLAYAFQFWAAGKLSLPVGPAKGFFAKLRKFFRRVAGLIKDEEKAADILQAFNDGKLGDPSTAGKVLNDIMSQGTWTKQGLKNLDGMVQMARRLIVPAEEILLRTPSAAAKALAREFYTNPGDETSAGMAEGMLNAQRTITTREMNKFAKAIEGLDDKDMINVAELLQKQIDPDTLPKGPYRRAVRMIREQLDDFHTYLKDHNVEVGKIENYFPRAWSLAKLMADPSGFTNMLLTHYDKNLTEIVRAVNLKRMEGGKFKDGQVEMTKEEAALEILNLLVRRNGADGKASVQRDDGVLAPYFSSSERRELGWIQTIHSEPWQNKNLVGIMTSYIHEGVRTAEYAHRFGRKGELLDARLREIEGELVDHARGELAKGEFKNQAAADKWVQRQMKAVRNATGGMEGSLGKDISNGMRKFNSWMMVYQNVRLLPLTLFASVVDPMGMIARGATMREAFDAFQRGVTEVFRNWGDLFRESPKHRDADKWTILAEHIGAVDAAMLSHHVSEEYSSTYLTRGAKQINDTFFKVNGMEAWNRGMRIGAVKNAVAFLQRHKSLPDVHSARWLQELGLSPDAITLDADGDLITDVETLMAQTGVTKGEAQRQIDAIHSALNRWVLSAILTPNAAQRPAWASDPHYSLFFHLKQFSYSFHQTILKRAVKEMNHGNLGPIATFAGYIPVMIASDVMKGLLIGGGELPQHMKGMDLGDWVMRGLERSGTLGIGAIGVDASHDMFSVLGPSAEQVVDGITSPIADTTLRALPLNPILRAVAE